MDRKVYFSQVSNPEEFPDVAYINCGHPRIAQWLMRHPAIASWLMRLLGRIR